MLLPALLSLVSGSLLSGDWTALPLPSLCDPSSSRSFGRLDGGRHLLLEAPREERTEQAVPELTPNDVGALLETSARSAGIELERFPYAPPLLVRGTETDLAWAREELDGLARASRRNQVELVILLAPGSLTEAQARELFASEAAPSPDSERRLWRRTVTPGMEATFGERERREFLADYDVNVATDSGVAAPRIGCAVTGKTLHLSTARVERGAGVFLRGWLDLTEELEVEEFDPGSPDLGQIEEPHLTSLGLGFSGVLHGSELLRVEVGGAPLQSPDWTLFIRATTQPEPANPALHDWVALDLSLVTEAGASYSPFAPGAALGDHVQLSALRARHEPLSPMGVLAAAEPRRRSSVSGAGATRAASHVASKTLLLSSTWWKENWNSDLASLLESLEAPRLQTEQLVLTSGSLRVSFPVAAGEAARLVVGSERTLLTGYHADIAPNTWMPSPIIEHLFDGIAWQGRQESDGFRSSAWRSGTREIAVRSRHQANMGALQLARREVEDGTALLDEATSVTLIGAKRGRPALVLQRN